ncbi:MAG TPA: hypothetical protein VGH91_12755 [Gammaproteobacteria bacterium]|jgi:hypothetical protein
MRIGTSICFTVLGLAACAQAPVYTAPYTTIAPVTLTPPLLVTLDVSYAKDGKPDTKRAQELSAQLRDALAQGNAFRPADAGAAVGALSIELDDAATTTKSNLWGTLSADVGHLLVAQPEFSPQGRRSARLFKVMIRYTPVGGSAVSHDYSNPIVTVTNNTQDPTDLVPMQDRKHAELTFIGNDLNDFAAGMTHLATPRSP